ncbi:MAG: EMC3/TMCO1 family protein [Thermoplasmata archaeon]
MRPGPRDEEPLPSGEEGAEEAPAADGDGAAEETDDAGEGAPVEAASAPAAAPARPPPPKFKISTFVLVFLGMLGFLMLIDTGTRTAITQWMGSAQNPTGWLYVLIGFHSQYLLLTMALAGAIEMAITAIAYNYTTDWIKTAKVQKWSSAFRKVQMAAYRSGKRDRIDELKPFQQRLTRLSSEVSIAQFKGMAVTWFLLIVIYSWVGQVIADAPSAVVHVAGPVTVNLMATVAGYFPYWFFMFSLYTIPLSFVFRRFLKHYWLVRYEEKHLAASTPSSATGS